MKKCPQCGAELQEGAQFCVYCMHSLNEKTHISTSYRSKRTLITVILSLVILSALIAGICITSSIQHVSEGEGVTSLFPDPKPADTEESSENSIYNNYNIISSFDDFALRAVYLTGKMGLSDLWDPDGFVNTHKGIDSAGHEWKIYSTDVKIENVSFRTYFCNGGKEIITTITGLTEETYNDGAKLAECAISSTYNYTYTNLKDLLTDRINYPLKEIQEEVTIMSLYELFDPAAELTDPGTLPISAYTGCTFESDESNTNVLYFELRTRIYNGETVYDIILLHSQN